MSISTIILPILNFKVTVLTLVVYFVHQCNFSQHGAVLGDINTQPLWNTTFPLTQTCFATHDNVDNTTVYFQGGIEQTCSLQVSLPKNSALQLLTPDSEAVSYFMFLEYTEYIYDDLMCPTAYEVVTGHGAQCSTFVTDPEIIIHLQGNASLVIKEIPIGDRIRQPCIMAKSSEDWGDAQVSQTSGCVIKSYNKTLTCTNPDITDCSIYFPSECTSVVADREVTFHCTNTTNEYHDQIVLILYNINTASLDIAANNIDMINQNAFQDLQNLLSLSLSSNNLVTLEMGVFGGMRSLFYMALSVNRLQNLPVGLFQDLESLFFLYLDNNDLETLESGVFLGLSNLFVLNLGANKLSTLQNGVFEGLNFLSELYLFRNQLALIHQSVFMAMPYLQVLDLYSNQLKAIQSGSFQNLNSLFQLDLSKNVIDKLDEHSIKGLDYLSVLYFSDNNLDSLPATIFNELNNLKELSLANNRFKRIKYNQFENLTSLTYFDLSGNKLDEIPSFINLSDLKFLNLKGNTLIRLQKDDFYKLQNSTELYVTQQEICECFMSSSLQCNAAEPRSPYLTCERLLSDRILMGLMWVIGINALCGNLFVLAWRVTQEKQATVQSILLSNLAMSDFLMGVYMVMIAAADNYFDEYFPMQAESWRTGITCRIAGAIAIVASEASVFFVALISIDRFINLKFPLSTMKLRKKSTVMVAGLIWFIALGIGVIPSALAGVNVYFYDNSHVCIGLPLAKLEAYSWSQSSKLICTDYSFFCFQVDVSQSKSEGLITGMYFSTAVFLGLNCICYLIILSCYIQIIQAVFKSSRGAGVNKEMLEQIRLTAKVTAIVATDFFCWFPIIILGILVQAGVLVLPPSVFAWCVTFVLPINSAINPYLYTISHVVSVKGRQKHSGRGTESQTQLSVISNRTQQEHAPFNNIPSDNSKF